MSTKNTLRPDDLRFAAEWLRVYEGEETAVAELVAEWLDAQADAKELRDAAKQHGVPVGKLRTALKATRSAA